MARTEAQRRYEDKVEFGGNRLVVLERDGYRSGRQWRVTETTEA